jgi:hypothetical protein
MARSEVSVQSLSAYNTAGAITQDAIDTANGNFIDLDGVKGSNLAIFVETSDTEPFTFTFKAGDFSGNGIGDLTYATVTAKTSAFVLETSRFKDSDEYVLIDNSGATGDGYIYAVELP